ncbi:MAG: hypothetical protein HKM93_09855 [Desulfobacteraceae bacterium]|nr:hypothetical protein [Desulfobacteraceae bacterium]
MTTEFNYEISDTVFEMFPGYNRGVVVARGVTNGESPPELIALLRAAESAVRDRVDKNEVANHQQIAPWRDAFRSFGAKPGKYRSSIEAMVRRVLGGNEIPSINALVDIGNALSLKYVVPMGGHAIDVVKQDLRLRPAGGEENFTAFGSDKTEHPKPGEIIFTDGDIVLTRRWSWRQAKHTLTLPETTAIEFNIDGLPPLEPGVVEEICRETGVCIQRFCGGETEFQLLNRENPAMKIVL